jgi:putative tryptophan/tyrosine transport system substrate-binding protein
MLAVAKGLVDLPVDVLVSWGTVAATAAKRVTSSIPVVFLSVPDPVTIGLVASLAHPGGNMTGVTFDAASETSAKRLQMLKEAVSRLARVAVLDARDDPNVSPQIESMERAAPALGVHLVLVAFQRAEDLAAVFARFPKQNVQGLIVLPGALTFANRAKIADLALAERLPSMHAFRESVAVGVC